MRTSEFVLFWLACSVYTYGLSVAYYQREYPQLAQEDRIKDRIFSAILSLIGGPIALFVTLISFGFRRGWML